MFATDVADFFNTYLFHWVPAKAIWIGGHTLSWDARCAGIYAGFGGGVLYQLAAYWRAQKTVSLRATVISSLFALPLFLDVFTLSQGLRAPSNDIRYLTGLFFGTALSVCVFPAFLFLARSRPAGPAAIATPIYPLSIVVISAAAFVLKGWNDILAYALLQGLSIFGFLALAVILCLGALRAVWIFVRHAGAAKMLLFLTMAAMTSGCAAPAVAPRSEVCDVDRFVPSNLAGSCKREICANGKVVLVEDLAQNAPVDDWAEEKFCLWHPIDCYRAYSLKRETETWQKDMAGKYWDKKDLHNGVGDAARHVYLMCRLTERFGPAFARALGIAHEEDSGFLIFSEQGGPSNPCCEKAMDLYNNEIGIALADKPGSCEEKTLAALHLTRHSLCPRETTGNER